MSHISCDDVMSLYAEVKGNPCSQEVGNYITNLARSLYGHIRQAGNVRDLNAIIKLLFSGDLLSIIRMEINRHKERPSTSISPLIVDSEIEVIKAICIDQYISELADASLSDDVYTTDDPLILQSIANISRE
jgi:hypothetical protein